MPTLYELAKTIRSKNAGPDIITFDVIFEDDEAYGRVKKSGVLSRESVAALYGLREEDVVEFVEYDNGRAIKFSILRPSPAGGMGESDVFGCQQYPPLFDIDVP